MKAIDALIEKYKTEIIDDQKHLEEAEELMESGEYNDYRECAEDLGYYRSRINRNLVFIEDLTRLKDKKVKVSVLVKSETKGVEWKDTITEYPE